MQDQPKFTHIFTPEMIDAIACIWIRSTISVMDVRLTNIYREHPLRQYKMPSSMFIYAYGGAGQIELNQTLFGMERFGLIHGGKGTMLNISPREDKLKAFMVFYKADLRSTCKKGVQQLLEQVNPFVQQFAYAPSNPVLLLDFFQQMINVWNGKKAIGHLHGKSIFYHLIHEVYRDLENSRIKYLQPDPALFAKRYLDENYRQPIMFQEIADICGISSGQLTRLFKKKEGVSLQEYLIHKRLEVACYYLNHTNMTIKEIAMGCGFLEENNLLRMFKKHYKLTPTEYRKIKSISLQVHDVDNDSQRLYNEKGLEKLVKSKRDGEFIMFGSIKRKEMIVAAAMSLMLLLSACGSVPINNSGPASTTSTSSIVQAKGEVEKRIVKAANGEIEVPSNPQRLVVSGFAYGDIIPFGLEDRSIVLEGWVDLDNKSKDWREYWGHATTNTTQFESFEDLEGIMTLNPDIIIGTTGQISNETEIDLQKVTTTILYDQENIDKVNYTMGDRMTFLGELFGMPEKAQQLIEAFEEKATTATQALVEEGLADKKIVFVHGLENGTPIIATDINQSLTYKILGMSAPAKVNQEVLFHDNIPDDLFSNHVKIISMEVLPEYIKDADIIIYRHLDDSEETISSKISEIAVWASIPAVQNGNVLYVPYTDPLFGFSYADYLVALDTFVDRLKQLPIAQS